MRSPASFICVLIDKFVRASFRHASLALVDEARSRHEGEGFPRI